MITICEVGLRDGIQNEQGIAISTADRLRAVDALVAAGVTTIELTSFVSPKAVPMMAGAADLMRAARAAHPDVRFTALVFNERGYEDALAAGADAIALVLVVTDGLSEANTGRPTAHWRPRVRDLVTRARNDGIWVRVYLAGAWVCPYDGPVPLARVLACLDAAGDADELCPTDVIGHAHPLEVETRLGQLGERVGVERLAVHLHDTQALGIANAYAAIRAGVRTLDASFGGLGGCPFAPGSRGNVATEDLVLLLDKMGLGSGIDRDRLLAAVAAFEPVIGRSIGGRTRSTQ
jgi:hydroxymethylglutaryl-CoA lyase